MADTTAKDRVIGPIARDGNRVELPETDEKIQVFNGIPNYPAGYKFGDKFVIEERTGWDDRFGATYFATPQKSDRPLELVLRVDNLLKHNPSILMVEIAMLRKADEHHKHQFFAQLHEQGRYETDYFWYTTYFKGGPSLRQITDFMRQNRGRRFSASTIIGFMHSCNFLICAIDQEMFHLDAASRTLFLSDLSTIHPRPKTPSNLRWCGGLNYTPLAWSAQIQNKILVESLTNVELEAVFYLLLEMALGGLPWAADHSDVVAQKKIKLFEGDRSAFKALPQTYFKLWENIVDIVTSDRPYSDLSVTLDLCQEIYKKDGGCSSWDDDFDFERQPTPEELPKFVMEKVANDPEAQEIDQGENGEKDEGKKNKEKSQNKKDEGKDEGALTKEAGKLSKKKNEKPTKEAAKPEKKEVEDPSSSKKNTENSDKPETSKVVSHVILPKAEPPKADQRATKKKTGKKAGKR
ncbi:unnamed protein product [Bursaphelenchus okinawaensis]|uniref:Protein kinase domain-containing protein n=1 Tax=Bursaphelenchus okinawaensis TaxID=465554 RepID=A0A811K3H8_9BILA|nr:unnamed protein product [Bursaphelenchus okinawaensis]CAG9089841.1 unnamed protein product [Bursaphelenchus okinawaensis]